MADNYVVREKYTGMQEVDGMIIPVRGNVPAEELVQTSPEDEGAVRNGGGKRGRKRQEYPQC